MHGDCFSYPPSNPLPRSSSQIKFDTFETMNVYKIAHLNSKYLFWHQYKSPHTRVRVRVLQALRPLGVRLMTTVVERFSHVPDLHVEGHSLLELHQAQIVSTLR